MKTERVLSMDADSMIYHKPNCHYVKTMSPKNRMSLAKEAAQIRGYRICKCCNSMSYHYRTEQNSIEYYRKNKKMDFKFIDGMLFVKTEIGCWKMVYSKRFEDIVLYHRNSVSQPLNFEHPENEPYHRQTDALSSHTISSYLNYIHEHDRYKAAKERGEKNFRFSSKKYARHEAKAQRKQAHRRVDQLFMLLEKRDSNLLRLSIC